MKRKLLQINSVLNTGSTGRIAEEIGLQVMAEGWESYIAYGRYGNSSSSVELRIGSKLDTYLHVIRTRFFDGHGFGSKSPTKELIKYIDKIKPDIIHIHNIHGYYINIQILFNYLAKINTPIVWTLHDCWSFTGHCSHYSFVGCEKWKTQCYECPQIYSYPKSFIDNSRNNFKRKREIFNMIENLTIVPVSKWLKDQVGKSYLYKTIISQIYNGVDLNIFKPQSNNNIFQKLGISDKNIYLGVASTWTDRKGFHEFIKLSKRLDADERIVLVGVSRQQKKLLPHNVIGIERTENIEEMACLYSGSKVFINLTFEDTFPTTNIEALACGTPVLTYETGGSVEAVDEKTGWVVKQGDIDEVRKILDNIKATDASLFDKECRLRSELFFDKNKKYKEYLTLYNQLIQGN